MIDTLKIRLNDYTIDKKADLSVEPPTLQYKTGEVTGDFILYRDKNHTIEGKKAYYNGNDFQVDLIVKKGAPLLMVKISLPKLINGSNYNLLDGSISLINGSGRLENKLNAIGIHTNIKNAYLSRLDLTKNVYTDYKFPVYAPVYETLKMNRTEKRDYGSTYLYRNTQKQFAIYDKIEEMKRRKELIKGLPNTTRAELRLLTKRKIKDSLQIEKVSELINIFDDLPDFYHSVTDKELFNFHPKDFNVKTESYYRNIARQCRTKTGGFSVSNFIKTIGTDNINKIKGQYDLVLMAVREEANNRMALTRVKTELQKGQERLLSIDNVKGKIRTLDLYNELKTKIVG